MADDADDDTIVDPKLAAQHLRDEMLTVIKGELPKPWPQMNEHEQARIVGRLEQICRHAILEVCEAINGAHHLTIGATLGKLKSDTKRNLIVDVTFNPGLDNEQKLGILAHLGAGVTVTLMDVGDYTNYRDKVEILRDEPTLPLETREEVPQPQWDKVSEALQSDNKTPSTKPDPFEEDPEPKFKIADGKTVPRDDPDAHEAVEDDTVTDSEVEEEAEEDGDQLGTKLVNLPNPTKGGAAAAAAATMTRPKSRK